MPRAALGLLRFTRRDRPNARHASSPLSWSQAFTATAILPGSECPPSWRWQCLAAVALALGKGVELEHDHGMVGQQRDLDAPA